MRALQLGQFHVQLLELRFRFRLGLALLRFLRGDLVEVRRDLAAPLVEARLDFALLDDVDLQCMRLALQARDFLAAVLQAALQVRHGGVGAGGARARLVQQQRLRAELLTDVVDLVLAREHAVLLRIGRVEAHARA